MRGLEKSAKGGNSCPWMLEWHCPRWVRIVQCER